MEALIYQQTAARQLRGQLELVPKSLRRAGKNRLGMSLISVQLFSNLQNAI